MNEPKIILAVALTSLAVLSSCEKWRRASPRADSSLNQQTAGESAANSPVHADEIWICPMHPQIREHHPGTCPICGMNLVKAEPEATDGAAAQPLAPEGHAAFTLSEPRAQMIGVKLGSVVKKPVFKTIDAAGRIAFDPDLYAAESEYIAALRQQEQIRGSTVDEARHAADRMVDSSKAKLRLMGLAEQQITALAGLRAPRLGLLPNQGDPLWVYAEIFEIDLPLVKAGMNATISGDALGKKNVPGKVITVDNILNPATRTAKARIRMLDPKIHLRPESYVDVSLAVPLGERLTVPADAVLDTGKEAWVFVSRDTGVFEPRRISIAERAGDEVVIDQGVNEGEKIVTSANFLIDAESRLRAAPSFVHKGDGAE